MSKYSKKLALVVVIAVALVLVFFRNSIFKVSKTEPLPKYEQVKRNFIRQSKVFFPEVSSFKQDLIPSDLPKPLLDLFNSKRGKASFPVFEEDSYVGGKEGYKISFDALESLSDTYNGFISFLPSNGWEILFKSNGALASMIEVQNSDFKMRILQTVIGDNKNEVFIQVVKR